MRKPVQNLVDSPIEGRPARAIIEVLIYVFGAGILFYLVDVLFMSWQGLTLH